MTALPPLETERLIVRPFVMDDFDALQTFGAVWGSTPEALRRWLSWIVANYEQLALLEQLPYGDRAVVLKATGELIGSVGLVPFWIPWGILPSTQDAESMADPVNAKRSAEMALFWMIHEPHRRNGYAAEAARALIDAMFARRLSRIVATTSFDNLPSQAVMHKLGMRVEKNLFPDLEGEWQVVGTLENPITG